MKIHYVINSLVSGGAERVVSNLANYFASIGHDVTLFVFSSEKKAYELHPKVMYIPYTRDYRFLNFASLKCLFFFLKYYNRKENRPDVINSHMSSIGFGTIPISKIFGIPLVVSEHINHLESIKDLENRLVYTMYQFIDAITILTQFDLVFFKRKNKNTFVVPNPSSFEVLSTTEIATREKTILAVGNLNRHYQKGYDNLILIMGQILPKNLDWKLKIVGEGDEGLTSIKKLINKYNIQTQVELLGFRNDVNEIMKKSEIFILPSRFEGLPMVLIEALSQQMVCIAYDCVSGPSDIIRDNQNGVLVNNQNNQEMVEKLQTLIDDDVLRNRLRKNAQHSIDKFSIEKVARLWIDIFDKITAKKKLR